MTMKIIIICLDLGKPGMLSLETNGVLLDTSSQTPSPNKDYINLCVTFVEVSMIYFYGSKL